MQKTPTDHRAFAKAFVLGSGLLSEVREADPMKKFHDENGRESSGNIRPEPVVRLPTGATPYPGAGNSAAVKFETTRPALGPESLRATPEVIERRY